VLPLLLAAAAPPLPAFWSVSFEVALLSAFAMMV